MPPPFTASLRREDGRLVGIVSRRHRGYLRDALVLYNGYVYRLALPATTAPQEVRLDDRIGMAGSEDLEAGYDAASALRFWVPAAAGRILATGERPAIGIPSDIFLLLDVNTAMLVAFAEETDSEGGTPVQRQVCIRQLVPVSQ